MTKGLPEGFSIVDVPAESRYEARAGDALAGWVDYRRVGHRFIAIHTEVPPEFGGRGIATALLHRVIVEARANGWRVSPMCPLFAAHFERHPEDRDVLAPNTPTRGEGRTPTLGEGRTTTRSAADPD